MSNACYRMKCHIIIITIIITTIITIIINIIITIIITIIDIFIIGLDIRHFSV